MVGFDAIYKQTITLFNRVQAMYSEETLWYPTIIEGVHLIMDKSSSWSSNGESAADNVTCNIRYTNQNGLAYIRCKPVGEDGFVLKQWLPPKKWRSEENRADYITFAYGDNDNFDFFIEGAFEEYEGPVSDSLFERRGFYNHMNTRFDNVFAIKSVSKYNLIPHFTLGAR